MSVRILYKINLAILISADFNLVFFSKCVRISDNKLFAVKIVSQKYSYHAIREIRILETLNPHENIVKIIEAINDPVHYYIILELLEGGELLNRLRQMVKFTELRAANIMSQLVSAVSHMHNYDVVHRDLKPEVTLNSFIYKTLV